MERSGRQLDQELHDPHPVSARVNNVVNDDAECAAGR
jgi:hypothetical protein